MGRRAQGEDAQEETRGGGVMVPGEAQTSPVRPGKPVERLFPFILRSRKLLVGREVLARSKSKLQWILIATDISESSRDQLLADFRDYPVVQSFSSADFERLFNVRNAKVLGFAKSPLSKSIYAELKNQRINKPVEKPATPAS